MEEDTNENTATAKGEGGTLDSTGPISESASAPVTKKKNEINESAAATNDQCDPVNNPDDGEDSERNDNTSATEETSMKSETPPEKHTPQCGEEQEFDDDNKTETEITSESPSVINKDEINESAAATNDQCEPLLNPDDGEDSERNDDTTATEETSMKSETPPEKHTPQCGEVQELHDDNKTETEITSESPSVINKDEINESAAETNDQASLTLQPFLAVPGQIPPVPWISWISLFESYVARSRCAEKVDLLMRFLGAGGRRVLWSLPGPTGTYEAIVAALSGHYQAREDAEKTREDGHKAREDAEKAWEDAEKAWEEAEKAKEDAEKAREESIDKAHPKKAKKIIIATVVTGLLTGVGAVVAAPFVLAGVGFTSGGIAASSLAASMMSSAAVANGGGVAAGSLVAVLQSAGAVGLTAGASAAVAGTGAAVGGIVGGATAGVITSLNSTSDDKKEPGEEDKDADPKKQS